MVVEEAKRSIHDALCGTRNLIKNSDIIYGGGSVEIACGLHLSAEADKITSVEQYCVRAFAEALEDIPMALAENSGLSPIEAVANIRSLQKETGNHHLGIDCMSTGENDMKKQGVFDPLVMKQQQFLLATQVVKMILKIDDVIKQGEI